MSDEIFEYGGYHFIPYADFRFNEDRCEQRLVHSIFSEDIPGLFSDVENRAAYNEGKFRAASSVMGCDLFLCVENDKLYLPCDKDLKEYIGSVDEEQEDSDER